MTFHKMTGRSRVQAGRLVYLADDYDDSDSCPEVQSWIKKLSMHVLSGYTG